MTCPRKTGFGCQYPLNLWPKKFHLKPFSHILRNSKSQTLTFIVGSNVTNLLWNSVFLLWLQYCLWLLVICCPLSFSFGNSGSYTSTWWFTLNLPLPLVPSGTSAQKVSALTSNTLAPLTPTLVYQDKEETWPKRNNLRKHFNRYFNFCFLP